MGKNKAHLKNNIINIYLDIWFLLSKKRKFQVISLFILMILGGISEIVLLGSFIPLIGTLSNPEQILENPLLKNYTNNLNSAAYIYNLRLIVAFLILSILVATIIRILNNYFIGKITAGIGIDLSYRLYKKTIYKSYLNIIKDNSSILINNMTVN